MSGLGFAPAKPRKSKGQKDDLSAPLPTMGESSQLADPNIPAGKQRVVSCTAAVMRVRGHKVDDPQRQDDEHVTSLLD